MFLLGLAYIAGIIALAVGWVMNIVTLCHFTGTVSTMGIREVARIIGIFVAPLGGVLGYF